MFEFCYKTSLNYAPIAREIKPASSKTPLTAKGCIYSDAENTGVARNVFVTAVKETPDSERVLKDLFSGAAWMMTRSEATKRGDGFGATHRRDAGECGGRRDKHVVASEPDMEADDLPPSRQAARLERDAIELSIKVILKAGFLPGEARG